MRTLVCLVATAVASCGSPTPPPTPPASPPPRVEVIGEVQLPPGTGDRGVEVRIAHDSGDDLGAMTWARLDAHGRFRHSIDGAAPGAVVVYAAGLRVHEVDVPAGDEADVGTLDLRTALLPHRTRLEAAEGTKREDVRIAAWSDGIPRGPMGDMPALGSAQFPEHPLPAEVDWLLPAASSTVYFLVERPATGDRGRGWKLGTQQVFGPYSLDALPDTLVID